VGLAGLVDGGTRLDAAISRALLSTIFWPGSALHDMGVVIRGDRVVAAGVQFPLAEGGAISPDLGSRHRAALGLAQESDALVLVVSEETGIISVAERNALSRELTLDDVRERLVTGLGQAPMNAANAGGREPIAAEES
jgi:diadenylate cyclase